MLKIIHAADFHLDSTFSGLSYEKALQRRRESRELLDRLAQLAKFYDAEYSEVGNYPAWEYRKDSPLRDTMIGVYSQMYGKAPQVAAIHAGLECGLLAEKINDLDCVAMGPTAYDIHTSREKLGIASVKRTWEFVQEVLKNL